MPQLSVIIPTHRRPRILAQCLAHLDAQTAMWDLEVIVVDDVGDEETRRLVESGEGKVVSSLIHVPPCQQGVARNEGLKHATGKYVLFLGDDIFLEPEACEQHLAALSAHSGASVLGFTTWDPACGVTPVMRWLEQSGWQFGYPQIVAYAGRPIPSAVQHRHTYTSHISLPATVAREHLFRTDVSLYGWEDVEWGMRLRAAGVPLVYEPVARALHHHHMEQEDSLRRMETLGRSAVVIMKAVPEFDRVPKGWKLLLYRLAALLPTMAGRHRKAFLRGITQTFPCLTA